MASERLGEMFEGDYAVTCAGKFPLVSMGGRAEGLACADPGARTLIGVSGNFSTKTKQTGFGFWFTGTKQIETSEIR